MNKKNGFTLIELLAVIVILAIILVIAGSSVINSINKSKEKAKYVAAKEIVEIASAYMTSETTGVSENCVRTSTLVDQGYLEKDVTNPATGKNGIPTGDTSRICKGNYNPQNDYKIKEDENNYYFDFDGYRYNLSK